MPKVSALMSVYNGQEYIAQTIKTILNQSFENFEFIIIDDGSTDNTIKIINEFKDDRIKLFKLEKNMGVGYALNYGLAKCNGQYIAKVDSDDLYDKNRFKIQKDFLDNNKEISVVASMISYFSDEEKVIEGLRYINLKNNLENQHNKIITSKQIKKNLYNWCCIANTAIMGRTEVLKKFGYNNKLRICEDYELFLKLVDNGYKFYKLDKILANIRVSDYSTTSIEKGIMYQNIYDIKKSYIDFMYEKYKNMYIWGASNFGINMLEVLIKNRKSINGFIDSDYKKIGTKINNVLVYSPKEILKNKNTGIIVASDPGRESIVSTLENSGFKQLQDYIVF
ncbi:glycosyltransferase [Clostridium sporogenes]|uniref:glycosyltransferase family 2 protein n=1 Tax=Clostridium sporogenes TaxID=1509 RepID=UPI0013D1F4D3|nr:glycosyltransferase [Clostridium sporogenes]EJE7233275.1 glycosyltransferase [Clostridium botulinum]NFE81714.1 glycosyltransferase [Clostridium sporogenes]NFG67695.1 glycosyltransferase [Clostridium sporogenes]